MTATAQESRLRRKAQRLGYVIYKSRERTYHSNNEGEYQLCDNRNTVRLGSNYDASLDDIDSFLAEAEAEVVS